MTSCETYLCFIIWMGGEPCHALCRRCRRTLLSGRLLRNCWTTLGSGVTTKKTAWTSAPEMWIPATPGLTRRSGNSIILDSSGGCIVAHRCSAWLVDTFHWQASFWGSQERSNSVANQSGLLFLQAFTEHDHVQRTQDRSHRRMAEGES